VHRFGIDPAVSPDAFVAAVTDVVGYGPSLGIATVRFGLACGGRFSLCRVVVGRKNLLPLRDACFS